MWISGFEELRIRGIRGAEGLEGLEGIEELEVQRY